VFHFFGVKESADGLAAVALVAWRPGAVQAQPSSIRFRLV